MEVPESKNFELNKMVKGQIKIKSHTETVGFLTVSLSTFS